MSPGPCVEGREEMRQTSNASAAFPLHPPHFPPGCWISHLRENRRQYLFKKNGLGMESNVFWLFFFLPSRSIAGRSLTPVASILVAIFRNRPIAFWQVCSSPSYLCRAIFKASLCAFSGYRGELQSKIFQQSQTAAAPDHQGPLTGLYAVFKAAWAAAASLWFVFCFFSSRVYLKSARNAVETICPRVSAMALLQQQSALQNK